MIWLNGLNGLKASAGNTGLRESRGARGETPFRLLRGGIASVTEPGVWKSPVAPGANSLCVVALFVKQIS